MTGDVAYALRRLLASRPALPLTTLAITLVGVGLLAGAGLVCGAFSAAQLAGSGRVEAHSTADGALASLVAACWLLPAAFAPLIVHGVAEALDPRREAPRPLTRLAVSAARDIPRTLSVALIGAVAFVAGLCVFIIPGLLIARSWALALPAALIERDGARAAFGSSRRLVRACSAQMTGVLIALGCLAAGAGGMALHVLIPALGVPIAHLLVGPAVSVTTLVTLTVAYFAARERASAA